MQNHFKRLKQIEVEVNMAASNTFKSVIAMRIRLGLLRAKIAIEPQKMMLDAVYAAMVIEQCRQTGAAELGRLADVFEEIMQDPSAPRGAGPRKRSEPDDRDVSARVDVPGGKNASAEREGVKGADQPLSPSGLWGILPMLGGLASGFDQRRDPDAPDAGNPLRYMRGLRS